jgi:hypothetical protein
MQGVPTAFAWGSRSGQVWGAPARARPDHVSPVHTRREEPSCTTKPSAQTNS